MAEWMIKRLIVQGREMESQIAARDRALFAGVDAQLEQHFMTPGQRLSPPGVGNVMLLMVCLTLGLAGVMGLVTDVAAAWSGKTSAAVLMGSGAIVAVWMTLILFQLVQGKNSGVVLLQYYLGMLGLCCLGAAAAWAAEDVRAIAEPSGALALAGLKKYVQQHNIQGERLAHVLSGANLNFHGLRYVSERCELGEQREALLAVTIPEQQGSFLKFCQLLGGRSVTEFNYRYADADNACIFVGVRLTRGHPERREIIDELNADGYQVVDLSDDEMAKLHVRYMVGGRPSKPLRERLYSFEFPESPGALLKFLQTLGTHWNISLFHYRSHGTDFGRVLAAFELAQSEPEFERHLQALGYDCHDETDNPAFRFFLQG